MYVGVLQSWFLLNEPRGNKALATEMFKINEV